MTTAPHAESVRLRTVTIPLWLWLAIFGIQLLGARDWGDAAAAAGLMVCGIWLYRLQRNDGQEGA